MSNPDDVFPHKNGKNCDVISPEVEMLVTRNVASTLQLPLLLPLPNFIVIGVS